MVAPVVGGAGLLQEEAAQGVEGLVILVQAVVQAAQAGLGQFRLQADPPLQGPVGPAHQGQGPLAAEAAAGNEPESPGQDLIFFHIGGVFLVVALQADLAGQQGGSPQIEAAPEVRQRFLLGEISPVETLASPVEDAAGQAGGQPFVKLGQALAFDQAVQFLQVKPVSDFQHAEEVAEGDLGL